MKNRKCRRCDKVIDTVDLAMTRALIAAEVADMIQEAADETGRDVDEVARTLIDPLLKEVTVCSSCFVEVNSQTPVKEFLHELDDIEPAFVWREVKSSVLDS